MHTREEVKRTMAVLDGIRPIGVHPSFRVRLMQRIEEESNAGALKTSGIGSRVNYRFALMLLLIIINLGSALIVLLQNAGDSAPAISEMLGSFGDDYSSSTFAYYQEPAPYAGEHLEAAPADLQTP
ncbi:hypothetical protein [Pelodictyon luteolum]|nr:hypothetical protein [Pelodictyon luteolum]